MKLSKVLLFAVAGVVVYKVLGRVKIVKVDVPDELPQEFTLASEVIREVYGEEFAKNFEKAMKDNKNKTNIEMDGEEIAKGVKLFKRPTVTDVQDATDEARKLIREYREISE